MTEVSRARDVADEICIHYEHRPRARASLWKLARAAYLPPLTVSELNLVSNFFCFQSPQSSPSTEADPLTS